MTEKEVVGIANIHKHTQIYIYIHRSTRADEGKWIIIKRSETRTKKQKKNDEEEEEEL